MDAEKSNPFDEMHVCSSCGAWVRSQRPRCPWCGTETVQLEQDDTATADLTSLYPESHPDAVPPHQDDQPESGSYDPHGYGSYDYGHPDDYAAPEYAPDLAETRIVDHPYDDLEPLPAGGADREAAPPATSRSAFGFRFWYRSFIVAVLFVVALMLGFAFAGVYQGLEDRQAQDKQEAIDNFVQGRAMLEDGRYDLARAYFVEALRLEPNFEAAAQLKKVAEEQANQQNEGEQAAEAVPGNDPDNERLFNEAMAAMKKEDWEMAAETFDVLNSRAAGFRTEEVTNHLFEARMNAGLAALEADALDKALRHFDHALSVKPNDSEAQTYRRMTSAYQSGRRAAEEEEWRKAADHFRVAYLLDSDFLDVSDRLFSAHLETASLLETNSIWCEAAQQYHFSLAVQQDDEIAEKAEAAEDRCEARQIRAPEPPTTGGSSPSSPDEPDEVVAAPSPTATAEVTPTPSTPALPFRVAGSVRSSLNQECNGHYIRGSVQAANGAPLPGVHILAIDEYGNRYEAISKQEPAGIYDIPVNKEVPLTYQVRIVSGGEAISPIISLEYNERFTQSPHGCYIVNWQRAH